MAKREMCFCFVHAHVHAQSCLTLGDPMDRGLPGSSVHEIIQARILKWVAISSSRGSSHPQMELLSPASPALAGRYFTTAPPGKPGVTWYLEGNRLRDSNPQDILILVGGRLDNRVNHPKPLTPGTTP